MRERERGGSDVYAMVVGRLITQYYLCTAAGRQGSKGYALELHYKWHISTTRGHKSCQH